MNILEKFDTQKRIEIEFMDNNLFIKNEKLVSIEEIKRLETLVKSIKS